MLINNHQLKTKSFDCRSCNNITANSIFCIHSHRRQCILSPKNREMKGGVTLLRVSGNWCVVLRHTPSL